eukprot:753947-Hanusia_phi.AAC.8
MKNGNDSAAERMAGRNGVSNQGKRRVEWIFRGNKNTEDRGAGAEIRDQRAGAWIRIKSGAWTRSIDQGPRAGSRSRSRSR